MGVFCFLVVSLIFKVLETKNTLALKHKKCDISSKDLNDRTLRKNILSPGFS
jgi:hypothetical protein